MSEKQEAYALIDQLGPGQLAAVVRLLETMVHDEEDELTGEDRQAVAASREYFRQNPEGGVPIEQAVAELGFTMDQVRGHRGH
jgi:ElaB/YqjD/DUF883 family membrane-anchored ribosome-binding protein